MTDYPICAVFEQEPPETVKDAIAGAVQRICEIHLSPLPKIITFGEPVYALVHIPSIEQVERQILAAEVGNVHAS